MSSESPPPHVCQPAPSTDPLESFHPPRYRSNSQTVSPLPVSSHYPGLTVPALPGALASLSLPGATRLGFPHFPAGHCVLLVSNLNPEVSASLGSSGGRLTVLLRASLWNMNIQNALKQQTGSTFIILHTIILCYFVSEDSFCLIKPVNNLLMKFCTTSLLLHTHTHGGKDTYDCKHTDACTYTHIFPVMCEFVLLIMTPPAPTSSAKVINLLIDPSRVSFCFLICCHGNASDPPPVLPSHLYLSCPSAAFSAVFKESYAPLPLYSLRYVVTSILFWIISTTWLFWF